MTGLTLYRHDPACNMHRFYRLDVQQQPDLFGYWHLVREWGRIGRTGQLRSVPYATEEEARAALERQLQAKEWRGYKSGVQ